MNDLNIIFSQIRTIILFHSLNRKIYGDKEIKTTIKISVKMTKSFYIVKNTNLLPNSQFAFFKVKNNST